MPANRKFIFANNSVYHIFNRGVNRQQIFFSQHSYKRFLDVCMYYQFVNPPVRFSYYLERPLEQKLLFIQALQMHDKQVSILAYCFMPNHFHFLLEQLKENGISKFMSQISNSYTKYVNTKYNRVGPLLQGIFKAVQIETDEQLMHASRYIHLNPVASYIMRAEELEGYPWSSYSEYLLKGKKNFVDKEKVLGLFPSVEAYKSFTLDQASYAQELEKIKHLTFEIL